MYCSSPAWGGAVDPSSVEASVRKGGGEGEEHTGEDDAGAGAKRLSDVWAWAIPVLELDEERFQCQ